MPAFGWLDLPPDHYFVQKLILECNYLQQAEGEMDPTHGAFLHATLSGSNAFLFGINAANPDALDAMARCAVVEDTPYGVVNGMTRRGNAGNTIVNVNHCMLPSFNTAPIFAQGGEVKGPWQNNFQCPSTMSTSSSIACGGSRTVRCPSASATRICTKVCASRSWCRAPSR
jgi:hypothetical protein